MPTKRTFNNKKASKVITGGCDVVNRHRFCIWKYPYRSIRGLYCSSRSSRLFGVEVS